MAQLGKVLTHVKPLQPHARFEHSTCPKQIIISHNPQGYHHSSACLKGTQRQSLSSSSTPLQNIEFSLSHIIPSYRIYKYQWMESRPAQGHSNGTFHGISTAINKSSKPDQPPTTPVSPSTAESSPVTSPPYWVQSHARTVSNISVESIAPGAIRLQDNTDGLDDRNEACWAKGVHIDDYVVINGSRTGIGAFVVWNVTVDTLSVSTKFPVTLLFSRSMC